MTGQCSDKPQDSSPVRASETSLFSFFFALFDITAVITEFIVADAVIFIIRNEIVYRRFRDIVQGLFCQESLMRGHNDVRHGDQAGQGIIAQDMTGTIFKEELKSLVRL